MTPFGQRALIACGLILSVAARVLAAEGSVPLPPSRPEGLAPPAERGGSPGEAAETPLPPSRPAGLEAEPHSASEAPHPDQDTGACLERIARLGVRAEPAPAVHNGACGAEHPLHLSGLGGVEVSPPVTVTCPVAEALARWAVEAVSAEADRLLGQPPKKLAIGTSYECRGQNRQAGAKLSEHAFANAVDVMGFEFENRAAIAIAPRADESPEALFQAAVRSKACAYFTTVLGPGSDPQHANHLHLDLRGRRAGSRICQ